MPPLTDRDIAEMERGLRDTKVSAITLAEWVRALIREVRRLKKRGH